MNTPALEIIDLFDLIKIISPTTSVLTPNFKLATYLHQQYAQMQYKEGLHAWPTPAILPLSIFLEQIYQNAQCHSLHNTPKLLQTRESLIIFKNIITQTTTADWLIDINQTAKLALSATALIKTWQITINDTLFTQLDEYQLFYHWYHIFLDKCKQYNWLIHADLPQLLTTIITQELTLLPKELVLINVIEYPPALLNLFDELQKNGISVRFARLKPKNQFKAQIVLASEEDEMITMARWAKHIITTEENQQIICAIPNLNQNDMQIKRSFADVFDCILDKEKIPPYHIATTKPLISTPIIQLALNILKLPQQSFDIDSFLNTLRSPFIGNSQTEYLARAKLEIFLKKENYHIISLNSISSTENNYFNSLINSTCPLLHQMLCNINESYQAQQHQTHSFSDWIILFQSLLQQAGFPGETKLNDYASSALTVFTKLLTDAVNLDWINEVINYQQAIETLELLTQHTSLHATSNSSPIQIIELDEANDIPCDYLWVSGLHQQNWPEQEKPHPFIPKSLQRQHQVPHTYSKSMQIANQTNTENLINHATNCIFSRSIIVNSKKTATSSLLSHLPTLNQDQLNLSPFRPIVSLLQANQQIELIDDDHAPTLDNKQNPSGGSDLLKQQAICPFKAFTQYRLHASEIDLTSLGLRAKDRGKLIHKILEHIWLKLKNHYNLVHYSNEKLNHLINHEINQHLNDMFSQSTIPLHYFNLEKKRLNKILNQWLVIERERPAFNIVACEIKKSIQLGKITFNLRIDRVDEINNQLLLIDYKTTSQLNIQDCLDERPTEPQLPLYALLYRQQVIGFSFASITAKQLAFKGISQYELDINGIKKISAIKTCQNLSWEEQLNQWEVNLCHLSNQFYQGIATVDPKSPEKSCPHCPYQAICRINEENHAPASI